MTQIYLILGTTTCPYLPLYLAHIELKSAVWVIRAEWLCISVHLISASVSTRARRNRSEAALSVFMALSESLLGPTSRVNAKSTLIKWLWCEINGCLWVFWTTRWDRQWMGRRIKSVAEGSGTVWRAKRNGSVFFLSFFFTWHFYPNFTLKSLYFS